MSLAALITVASLLAERTDLNSPCRDELRAASPAPPIWVAAWGDPRLGSDLVVPMVVLEGEFLAGSGGPSADIEEVARRLKARPTGRRALLVVRYANSFVGAARDAVKMPDGRMTPGPWTESATAAIAREWPRALQLLKHCGAEIDLLVGDIEAWGALTTWGMNSGQMDACRADHRWMEPRFGLPPLGATLADLRSKPAEWIRDPRNGAYLRWNLEIGRYAAAAMNEALWEPAIACFPALKGSNYQGYRSIDRPAVDMNGHQQPQDNVFGNGSSPALYGEIGSITNLWIDPRDDSSVAWSGTRKPIASPWLSFLICQQQSRAVTRSAPGMDFMPWIANPSYGSTAKSAAVRGFPDDLRCYDENIRHACVVGARVLLWWRSNGRSSPTESERLLRLVTEANEILGGHIDMAGTLQPIPLTSDVVVSGGRRNDGKWVWRVTASPSVAVLREVGTGREWQPSADSLGFWVVTSDNVVPRWEVARRRRPSDHSLAQPVATAPPPVN